MNDPQNADDDSVCFYCGYPDCRCDDEDDEDNGSVCEHGVGFDEDCEDCDELEYEDFVSDRVGVSSP